MSLTAFFTGVKTAQTKRLGVMADTFEKLVRQVADDVRLDPDEVAEQLDQLGRTAEELATAAQLVIDRRGWAAQLPREAELLAEHNQLYAEEQVANAECAEAIRQVKAAHAARVGPIQQRLVNIVTERDKAQTARNKLLQTSPERQRLGKLWSEHGEAVRALDGPLPLAMRQARPIDVGRAKGDIMETEARRDRLTVEIEKLEQEALRP